MAALLRSAGATVCSAKDVRMREKASPVSVHKPGPLHSASTRRHVLGVGIATLTHTLFNAPQAKAIDFSRGIESVELPEVTPPGAKMFAGWKDKRNAKDKALDDEFADSDYLKDLLAKSEANKRQRKIELENKYCRRGAEYGYGDCAGFKFDKEGNIILD
uniref:Uncharacterized protein n=1 Tax=Pyramimonas obovata TaxID=1411642 RepID=A0A7S0N681_9CHLO|mmetsp:Transcript_21747/g.47770  ORF Transcript_21747/g.47770 Transcript_21747/m.47770 type:complete len:160 (+) Transcript_21747:123-602(+)